MMKTKLGMTVGMMGAIMFFVCLTGNYVAALLLAGYILLGEENIWLKKTAVKAVVLMIAISLLSAVIGLVTDLTGVISNFQWLGDEIPESIKLNYFIHAVQGIITIGEKVLFILLGLFAFSQGTIKLPVVDSLINKYMD